MFNQRIITLLLAICASAVFSDNGLLPLAQAQLPAPKPALHIYDTTNPVYSVLEKPNVALTSLLDNKGAVDWMLALNNGIIVPRADLKGKAKAEVLNTDIVMKNTKEMPYVRFPHGSHTRLLACSNCHNEIFASKAGGNPVSMNKIAQGQYCGVCHGKVAFAPETSCERCHSIPR